MRPTFTAQTKTSQFVMTRAAAIAARKRRARIAGMLPDGRQMAAQREQAADQQQRPDDAMGDDFQRRHGGQLLEEDRHQTPER